MANDTFLIYLTEQLGGLGEITARKMMGAQVVYAEGVVIGLIASGELHLKADDVNRAKFDEAGWPAFRPYADRAMVMSFYLVPGDVLENRAKLLPWGREALAAGRRAALQKRPNRRAPRAKPARP